MNKLAKEYDRHAQRVAWLMPALGRSLKFYHKRGWLGLRPACSGGRSASCAASSGH